MSDVVDHTLSKTVGKVFAQGNKDREALDAYKRTINKIDDFFEYTNESKADREKIHQLLNSLNKKLSEIYND